MPVWYLPCPNPLTLVLAAATLPVARRSAPESTGFWVLLYERSKALNYNRMTPSKPMQRPHPRCGISPR
ncbi:exported hypothetical protein [Burkholderiales bacterium]|nr:exported hypothetical protein [Burkholderiales bacterium]